MLSSLKFTFMKFIQETLYKSQKGRLIKKNHIFTRTLSR